MSFLFVLCFLLSMIPVVTYGRESTTEYGRFVKLLQERLPDEWESLGRPTWFEGFNSIMYQVIWKRAGDRLREKDPELGASIERVRSPFVTSYAWFAVGTICLIIAGQTS